MTRKYDYLSQIHVKRLEPIAELISVILNEVKDLDPLKIRDASLRSE